MHRCLRLTAIVAGFRLLTVSASILVSCTGALAATNPALSLSVKTSDPMQVSIDSLSNKILAKQLEFLRLGLRLKNRGESKKLGRQRRQTIFALTNSSLTGVGAFIAAAGRLKYASNPQNASHTIFENASIIRFLANSISMGGVLVELGQDSIGAYRDRQNKLNLRSISKQANEIQQEVATLAKQRAESLAQIEAADTKHLYELEEKVLADVHEAALEDLGEFYSEAQGKRVRRATQLSIIFGSNLLSAAGSMYSGVIAPHQFRNDPVRRTRYGGVGGITDIASGSVNVSMPLVSCGSEMLERKSARKILFRQLGSTHNRDISRLRMHESALREAVTQTNLSLGEGFAARRKVVGSLLAVLKEHKEICDRERSHVVRNMILNILDSGADASGGFSKVQNGIGSLVGAYRYTFDDKKRFRVQGGTNLAYGIGNAIAVEEVLRVAVQREIKHAKSEKKHELLSQVLDDEIEEVEQAQTLLLATD